ncbi:hypothetical protein TetV_125 [Tetraselmis virus 1]|uniref:Uncharacterized protein n=1 Tax=Tetraselmis virus 1 TaxID=2060617 RepID=A0A2P0VMT1_9VIRU|nr:hypothetical protein QJ968_gp125 [Tetraselmis virus 1]AUF82217.1 hypothetical protein TetV_125 [Tetraselmis virus 1]
MAWLSIFKLTGDAISKQVAPPPAPSPSVVQFLVDDKNSSNITASVPFVQAEVIQTYQGVSGSTTNQNITAQPGSEVTVDNTRSTVTNPDPVSSGSADIQMIIFIIVISSVALLLLFCCCKCRRAINALFVSAEDSIVNMMAANDVHQRPTATVVVSGGPRSISRRSPPRISSPLREVMLSQADIENQNEVVVIEDLEEVQLTPPRP